jgi:hypothetical protein
VQVLIPPSKVDPGALLFISVILRRERYRYSFGRKWHLERMKETKIRLPATSAGEPDWKTMSNYMKGLPFATGALGEEQPEEGD